jgi:hypothetical protein
MPLFGPLFGGLKGARGPVRQTGTKGGRRIPRTSTKGNVGAATGRHGLQRLPSANAVSTVFQFDESHAKGTYTKVLSTDDDWVGFNFVITVTPTGNTLSTQDILATITQVQVLGPDGPVMTCQPAPDFYMLQQRFNPYHSFDAAVAASAATAVVYATHVPVSLPESMGPYTFVWSVDCSVLLGGATTAGTTEVSLSLTAGQADGQMNYIYSSFPATIAASGTQDLAPIAAVQGVTLTELFISGLSTNTTDFASVQIQSSGSTLGPRVSGYELVSLAQSRMGQTLIDPTVILPTDPLEVLYPLFALQSELVLGRNAHFYIFFGSGSISTSIRLGYCWVV